MSAAEIHGLDPFDLLDHECARVNGHFAALRDWGRPTRCEGWTARHMLSHLAGVEVYNRACLDDAVERLFAELAEQGVSGPHGFNAWYVLRFDASPVEEVLRQWRTANAAFRAEMRARGEGASIGSSVGPYPVGLQAFHLAMEYATHADDLGAHVDPVERRDRTAWRARVARFAIGEQAGPVEIWPNAGANVVRLGDESAVLGDDDLVEASQGRLPAGAGDLGDALRAALNYLP